MYTEFFKLCGYEEEEIERERPRIDRAFERLEIGVEDIARGERRLREFFDIDLLGMRKVTGIWVKQLIDLVLAKEEGKRIVYMSYPPIYEANAIAAMASEDIFAIVPDAIIDQTIGMIFDKVNPLLEAAEKDLLPPGLANCSLLQVRLGALLKGIIPPPDLFWSFNYVCNQSPKLDELLAERYGCPQIIMNWNRVENADDAHWNIADPLLRSFWADEMRTNLREFEEWAGFEIPEDRIKNDILPMYYNTYYADREIIDLLNQSDPVPMSIANYQFLSQLQRVTSKMVITEEPAALAILYDELVERVEKGVGVCPKGAPRVFWTLHSMTDPRIIRLVENSGIVPTPDMNPRAKAEGLSVSAAEKATKGWDLWDDIAEVYTSHGAIHCAMGWAKHARELCKDFKVDGAIVSYLFSCRSMNIWPVYQKEITEKEGFPAMTLEFDMYDTRDYSPERMRTRIETFAELVKARKAAKA